MPELAQDEDLHRSSLHSLLGGFMGRVISGV